MGPVPVTYDKIPDERCNCATGFIHDANLMRDAIRGNVKKPATVWKPAAPARATTDTGCQVAHFAALEGKNMDITAAAVWITPFT